jgi:hypothetical protein
MTQRVISADNHLSEPRELYAERLPAEYRDQAPRVLRAPDGGDGWSWNGRPPPRTFGLEAVAGQAGQGGAFKPSGLTWDEILPGNYDGSAHLADMDRDGIDGVVVYPGVAMGAYSVSDRGLARAVMSTYNDWLLDDFEAADKRRLIGLCALPVDADITVSFHRDHGGRPRGDDMPQLDVPGINVGGIAVRFFSAITPLTYMIFTGTFERFPTLRVVAGEVNCGWMPFWRENMDQNFDQQRHWANLPIERSPSSSVGTNVFVTTLDDHVGYAAMREDPSLADAVMYSIGYPHSVTLWPKSAEHIAGLTAGMDPVAKEKVLAGNAIRVYGFAP